MKKCALIIVIAVLGCTGCMRGPTPTPDGSYLYKGDLTQHGGTNCWYRCF